MQPRISFLPLRPVVCNDYSTTLSVLVRIRTPKIELQHRPPLNIGLCIDRSGSMTGSPLHHAIESGVHVVKQLEPSDNINVVAFNSCVKVVSPCQKLGPEPSVVIDELRKLYAEGGTALYDGWLESAEQTQKAVAPGRLSRVLLLSDGEANHGLTDPLFIAAKVSSWQKQGISTSTIGLGEIYNEDLLSRMAGAGAGNFHHVRTPEEMASVFHTELHSMSSTMGQAVSLDIETANGVKLLRVVNPLERTAKGRLKLADLVWGHPLDVVLELLVPPQTRAEEICSVRLTWSDVMTAKRLRKEQSLILPAVPLEMLQEFPIVPEVLQKRALQISARLMKEATERLLLNEIDAVKKLLKEGIRLLQEVEPSTPELRDAIKSFQNMLCDLHQGHKASARKQAAYYSSSVSSSSIVSSGAVRAFLALSPQERTPERLQALFKTESPL